MVWPEPLCLFPIYKDRTVYTMNKELEKLAEFDKRCIGLELQTAP